LSLAASPTTPARPLTCRGIGAQTESITESPHCSVDGPPTCPWSSSPQQDTEPFERSAQPNRPPACTSTASAGTLVRVGVPLKCVPVPSCPYAPWPQQ
jgi:hypothetical protein